MAPRVKNVKLTKNVNRWLRTGWDWFKHFPLSANPPPFKYPTPTPPIRQNLAIKFRQFSYVFTFFSTNTYLTGTYYISKLSEKCKEFYFIKIISVLWPLRKNTRGWWVIRHRKFPPPSLIHWTDWMKSRGAVHIWVLGPKLMNLALNSKKQKEN
jgi:hypothetical protein